MLSVFLRLQALELLPSSIEVREVYTFLLNVLEDKEKKRKNCQLLKSLLFAEHLQVRKIKIDPPLCLTQEYPKGGISLKPTTQLKILPYLLGNKFHTAVKRGALCWA